MNYLDALLGPQRILFIFLIGKFSRTILTFPIFTDTLRSFLFSSSIHHLTEFHERLRVNT